MRLTHLHARLGRLEQRKVAEKQGFEFRLGCYVCHGLHQRFLCLPAGRPSVPLPIADDERCRCTEPEGEHYPDNCGPT